MSFTDSTDLTNLPLKRSIFGLLKVGSRQDTGGPQTYLVTINPGNGNVTPVGMQATPSNLDGLTFIPDGLVQCRQPG